jgi:multicomponent Na+:H+ antiporter subunit D
VYRRALPSAWHTLSELVTRHRERLRDPLRRHAGTLWRTATCPLRADGRLAMPWSTHLMVWWVTLLLGLVLLLALL